MGVLRPIERILELLDARDSGLLVSTCSFLIFKLEWKKT
jgi:hypothetical protein